MYFGSVRFFKHLIISALLLIVLLISFFVFYIVNIICHAQVNADEKPANQVLHTASTNQSSIDTSPENDGDGKLETKGNVSNQVMPVSAKGEGVAAAVIDAKPYQLLHSDLYCEKVGEVKIKENTVFLTFDDGPSQRTIEIIEILKRNNIKATFFLVGKTDDFSKKIMRQIVAEGHTIAVHTFSHQYEQIYASVEAYLEDFYLMYSLIYETTGVKPSIFRFPGGSINAYNEDVYKDIIQEMERRGFTYFDWNVASSDAAPNVTAKTITHNVISEVSIHSRSIVLFHDSHWETETVTALDGIIRNLKNSGYAFDRLTNKDKPLVFSHK